MKQPFAIFRLQKLKQPGKINAAASHNLRTRPTKNADPSKPVVVIKCKGTNSDFNEAINQEIGARKVRKDSVKAVEIILTASPEYFRPEDPTKAGTWDSRRLDDWRGAVEPWIEENFPHAVLVTLHLDEVTPHIHIIDVPIDDQNRLSCKNKYGGKLRTDIARWHTKYAECVAHLGLRRGIEGSQASHTTIKDFYAEVNSSLEEVPVVQVRKPKELPNRSPLEYVPGTEANRKREEAEKRYREQLSSHLQEVKKRRKVIEENFGKHRAHAISAARAIQQRNQAVMTSQNNQEELKRHRDNLRALPLDQVIERVFGAKRTAKSGLKSLEYELPNGVQVGITEDKFILQREQKGGKGAINLVMLLADVDFKDAVGMLSDHFSVENIASDINRQRIEETKAQVSEIKKQSEPPKPNEEKWPKVKRWLEEARKLPGALIDALHAKGLIYADDRSNAVFVRSRGGAFVRSSSQHALFKRTIGGKDAGPFHIPGASNTSDVFLTEGPIDAMAIKAINHEAHVIAIGGNVADHKAIKETIEKRFPQSNVYAAFDNDEAGKAFHRHYPTARNHMPPAGFKDWAEFVEANTDKIDSRWKPNNEPKPDEGPSLSIRRTGPRM